MRTVSGGVLVALGLSVMLSTYVLDGRRGSGSRLGPFGPTRHEGLAVAGLVTLVIGLTLLGFDAFEK